MQTVLLVEDDAEIAKLISLHFASSQYHLSCCATGMEALNFLTAKKFDLVILDISLPDKDGMEICRNLRADGRQMPIMMLTCHGDESDKVLALDLGADDYVTKPFGVLELMARVKALLRRAEQNHTVAEVSNSEIAYKELQIDAAKRKVTLRGERLELTLKEFDLLWLMANNAGKTFSRKELLHQIWGVAFSGYEHTITSHINRLRLKLETDLSNPKYILTAWGSGYRFAE
jgi:DNA-binding response OmpR family regulator